MDHVVEPPRAASVWTPYPDAEDGVHDPARDVLWRISELLVAHGVASADVHLLLPPERQVRAALRCKEARRQDAALAADLSVCESFAAVCPVHDPLVRRVFRGRGLRCTGRRDSCPWRGEGWRRHCAAPMAAVVEHPVTGERRRWCLVHLEVERAMNPGLRVVAAAH
ncbi:hypothetical protein N8J89_29775 [Crossiella sp. CA-258035]|uniref:hypothetical protein n=1 Tax=Crossiella sp. CA-258035 TaxID=2981138 RepID=UPI0024BC5628|nr:hypothetical protein [Crossiella sp. CA-258035]WHT17295.1 hypothetical protein N8J89_29775 [Crossiella sp. CA-258035]